jgi:ketosteroid isomerase-like protein
MKTLIARHMKGLIVSVLFAGACLGLVVASATDASSQDQTVVDTLEQVGQDMGDAMVAVDIQKLDQIYADDWVTIGSSGEVMNKEGLLRLIKSGKHKLVSFELGPTDVQVFGNVAAVHGSVTEKRIQDGKEDNGQFVWMDLLEKRAGKWVVVRSAGARVK